MTYKEKKKERRIRDKNRMRAKSISIAKANNQMKFWDETQHCNNYRYQMIRRPIRYSENLAHCSCFMCGNGRKYFGKPTFQEIRFFQYKKDND
jgi:predicted membrane protein